MTSMPDFTPCGAIAYTDQNDHLHEKISVFASLFSQILLDISMSNRGFQIKIVDIYIQTAGDEAS